LITAHKGEYVEIKRVILEPANRSSNVPDDTRRLPYVARLGGFLLEEAAVGTTVTILTPAERVVQGQLLAVNPPYAHHFGAPVPELLTIGMELKSRLEKTGGEG